METPVEMRWLDRALPVISILMGVVEQARVETVELGAVLLVAREAKGFQIHIGMVQQYIMEEAVAGHMLMSPIITGTRQIGAWHQQMALLMVVAYTVRLHPII